MTNLPVRDNLFFHLHEIDRVFMVEEFAFDNADERRKVRQNGIGWIEVIAGSMFSGKSEELIRRLNRARIARQKVQVFKPGIDVRYSDEEIASHSGQKHISIPVADTAGMLAHIHDDTEVVGIDEAQFFDMAIIAAVNELAERGKRVIVAGLDQDYTGRPFEPMPQLLSVAEYITKIHAICVKCGATANFTQRTVESDELVEVGASDKYEARCRKCFVPHADAPTLHAD